MIDCLIELQKVFLVGIVGGSDLIKIEEQVGKNIINMVDFCFT